MDSQKQPSIVADAAAIPPAEVAAAMARLTAIKWPARWRIVVLVLGWLFDFLAWRKAIGAGFALFAALCLLAGMILLILEGYRPARNSLWLVLPFGFFLVITFLRQEPLTIFLAYTFVLFAIAVFANTYLGGRWLQYGLLDYLSKLIRLLAGILYLPTELLSRTPTERAASAGNKTRLPWWALLRGVILALPVVTCFGALLASADPIFRQKLGDFFGIFDAGRIADYLLQLIVISVVAYVLAGIFLFASAQSRDAKLVGEDRPLVRPFLGITEASIVMGSVALLFTAFVAIQFRYFFGGETNIGIAGYTYSQYARRGFNELIFVALFSLVMILGLSTMTGRRNETEKRVYSGLSVVIVALVMVILVSAYQRISLAIDWHGFSRLRLYPRVFLVWLGILLVVVVLLEIFRRERYFALAAVLASLGFAVALTLVNVDAAIVKHNVPRVLAGKNLNVAHLASLSWDAVPALAAEYRSTAYSPDVHEGLGAALACYLNNDSQPGAYSSDWRSFNLSRWRAHQTLQSLQSSLQEYGINEKRWPVRARTPSGVLYACYYYDRSAED